jgi:lipoprotein-releasing system permease protein
LPKIKTFRVGGWVTSGLVDVDSHLAYGHLKELQRFSGVGDVVNEIRVRTPSIHDARTVRNRLRTRFGDQVRIRDWQERNQGLFSALKLERVAMFLVLTINILLAAFSIISTLVMTLIERRREIAILNAMGTPRRSLVSIFVHQGLFTGLIGSYLGTMIGVGSCIAIRSMGLPLKAEEIYYIESIPVDVHALDVGLIVCVALSVSLLSTLYPAYFASKIKPVEGLKGR